MFKHFFLGLKTSLLLSMLIGCIDSSQEQKSQKLYGLPARVYNTPEKRMNWWNNLEWRWQKVFNQILRGRQSAAFTPTDNELKGLFVEDDMMISDYLNVGITLTNLTGLVNLTNLNELSILNQSIEFNEFVKLPQLKRLFIGQANLNLENLSIEIPNISYLHLSSNSLKSLRGISKFIKLEELNVGGKITALYEINQLKDLKELNCFNNLLNNLQGIENAPSLENLNVSRNHLTSIEGIETVPNLRELDISDNPNIKDLTPILQCKRLKILKISGLSVEQMVQLKKGISNLRVVNTKLDTVSKGY